MQCLLTDFNCLESVIKTKHFCLFGEKIKVSPTGSKSFPLLTNFRVVSSGSYFLSMCCQRLILILRNGIKISCNVNVIIKQT